MHFVKHEENNPKTRHCELVEATQDKYILPQEERNVLLLLGFAKKMVVSGLLRRARNDVFLDLIITMKSILTLLILLLPFATFAAPQDERANKLFATVKCPTCAGQSVKESDTKASENIKESIRQQIKEGKSDSEILDNLREYYGDAIFFDPIFNWHNFLLWLLPFIGALLVIRLLRKHHQKF